MDKFLQSKRMDSRRTELKQKVKRFLHRGQISSLTNNYGELRPKLTDEK